MEGKNRKKWSRVRTDIRTDTSDKKHRNCIFLQKMKITKTAGELTVERYFFEGACTRLGQI